MNMTETQKIIRAIRLRGGTLTFAELWQLGFADADVRAALAAKAVRRIGGNTVKA